MVVGPAILHYTPQHLHNTTIYMASSLSTAHTMDQVRTDIDMYLAIIAIASAALFSVILVYFPSKPPRPPTTSSTVQRTEFLHGIRALLVNRDVLLATFAFSVTAVSVFPLLSQQLSRECREGMQRSWSTSCVRSATRTSRLG